MSESGMECYKIAHTAVNTPINLIYVENESVDLYAELWEVGIATVSGISYNNLGKNAVRIMLSDNIDIMIRLMKKAAVNIASQGN